MVAKVRTDQQTAQQVLERSQKGAREIDGAVVNFTVTPEKMIRAYGLSAVTYFPHQPAPERTDARTVEFLATVGLPESECFVARIDVKDPYEPTLDAITIGTRFDYYELDCPDESLNWWSLGYLFTSLMAVDPVSGKVYAFPEGADIYIETHRDIESFAFALIELRKVEEAHENGEDPETLAAYFRMVVEEFDPTPFADDESQWNLSMEELQHGIW
ncbi:SUKH-4 family immunity protein [Streptomyces sp. NRRL S-448]|uniref:SUKH-4 family immunity protein n=1 Tax=Streptomyces sp. NRRL S-448 TaxID=1463907 RepID=UPI00356510CE